MCLLLCCVYILRAVALTLDWLITSVQPRRCHRLVCTYQSQGEISSTGVGWLWGGKTRASFGHSEFCLALLSLREDSARMLRNY